MTLGWKVPKFSGGSPILGYYVDKREGHHKNWHEVNSSPLKERILTVGVCGFVYFIGVIFLIWGSVLHPVFQSSATLDNL